jgi:hypothetical protein
MTRTENLDEWEEKRARRRKVAEEGSESVSFVTKLGAAKHALALTEEMPDLSEMLDNAEAVRAAAKAKHVSTPGVNAWMRFIIDIERKGWQRIEAMQQKGELAKGSGTNRPSKENSETRKLAISDLVAPQRATEWSMLARLTEQQLDETERVANEEDRLLTRSELLRLAKAGVPEPTKEPKERSEADLALIERAQEIAADKGFSGENIAVHEDAKILKESRGSWVAAWVWIEDELTRSDLNN